MLTEDRQDAIVQLVEQNQSMTSQQLMKHFDASESTIRRDLQDLENKGLLYRVRGGAKAKNFRGLNDIEAGVASRRVLNREEKEKIAAMAVRLIEPGDTVYIDGGTSTECLVKLIQEKDAFYVTNAINHARILSEKGLHVSIPGGQYRALTEAVVGEEACEFLDKYNFSIGFFGTNGICETGYTTPDLQEAMLKKKAVSKCAKSYVLADHSKYGLRQRISFAQPEQCTLICDAAKPEEYSHLDVLQA